MSRSPGLWAKGSERALVRGGLGYVGTGASPVTALRPWRAGFCSEVTSEVQEESKGRNRYDYFKLGFIDLIRNPQNHKDLFYDPKDGHLSNKRVDRKSTRLNSSHVSQSRMPSSA